MVEGSGLAARIRSVATRSEAIGVAHAGLRRQMPPQVDEVVRDHAQPDPS
jgi:hypothetical protein